jgi:hypothetical protein
MGFSIFPPAAESASNDFTISAGTSGFTNVTLSTTFPAGSYICTSSLSDTTLDIYLLASDGSIAGFSNASTASTTVIATKSFNTVVVYGAANNDTLTFQFKYVFSPSQVTTNVTAPPRLVSIGTASLPNINNTTTITGENFATDITVTFTGSDSVVRSAKSVVRNSSSSLTVTRPDSLSPTFSPYTVTLTNPGVTNPTSSGANRAVNGVTSGSNIVWVTSTINPMYFGQAFSQQLSATDADAGSTVTYALASGSFPTGVSVSSSGLVSGTPSSNTNGTYSPIISATDSGGNVTNQSFSFLYSAALGGTITNTSGSTIQHSFSANGTFTPYRSLTISYTLIGGGGGGAGGKGGGGGGGGGGFVAIGSTTVSSGQAVTLGGSGAGGAQSVVGSSGTASSIGGVSASGGNGGGLSSNGNNGGAGGNGGSGGGGGGAGSQPSPAGTGGNGGSTGGAGNAASAANSSGTAGAGGTGSGNASSPGGGGGGGGGTNSNGRGGGGTGGNGAGNGGYGNQGDPSAGVPGNNANATGGGGGGGGARWGGGGATGYSGGNGFAGSVTITY